MTLWIVLAAMTLAAAALVVVPLIGRSRAAVGRAAHEIEIYRDQLAEIERDLDRRLITTEQAAAARSEIGRRLLAIGAADATDPAVTAPLTAEAADTPAPRAGGSRLAPIALGALVPALALVVYLSHGTPLLPGKPAGTAPVAASGADADSDAALQRMVSTLAAQLEKDPENLRNWASLADALARQKRYGAAAVAWGQAMRLAPDNAAFAALHGEMLTLAAEGQVTPDARAAFEEAHRRTPGEARAAYYLGLADVQAGKRREALGRWLQLEAASPTDAAWMALLRSRIARLAADLGLDRDALADLRETARREGAAAGAGPRGPTREDVEAAKSLSADDRMAMIRSMVDGLATRLESSPDDVDGWMRLGRARAVLGEKAASEAAYAKAAALKPDDVGIQLSYADSIVASAEPGAPDAARLKPVVDRVLSLAPQHPRGLWLAGALALSANDREAARRYWTRLLDLLDPNSIQYVELKKQIAEIDKR